MSKPSQWDVAVVGGGLSGLAAATRLSRNGLAVCLVEAAPRVGGAIASWQPPSSGPTGGRWLFELGPNTVFDSEPAIRELIESAALGGSVVTADAAAGRRHLWTGERLEVLPTKPPQLLGTPLLSLAGKLRLATEVLRRRGPGGESVAEFARRRLGREALETFVAPFVSGIWAGDAARLALDHAFPKLAELERQHRSLVLGLRKAGGGGARRLIGLADGFGSLPDALAGSLLREQGEEAVRVAAPARTIERRDGGLALTSDAGTVEARQIVVATPAAATAELLDSVSGGASRLLTEVPTAALAVVSLGFHRRDVTHPLDGFGFLAPRGRGLRTLGCLFPSSVFPRRAPDDHVALTAMIGGTTDPAACDLDDADLRAQVLEDLERALGLRGEPVVERIHRWPRAIPQYELGHERFVAAAARLERAVPGLTLAGSYTEGVSVPDRVVAGYRAADRTAVRLAG